MQFAALSKLLHCGGRRRNKKETKRMIRPLSRSLSTMSSFTGTSSTMCMYVWINNFHLAGQNMFLCSPALVDYVHASGRVESMFI